MVDSVFVLMPAYNAGVAIEKVFPRIPLEMQRRTQRCVAVDDGSTDDTSEALRRLQGTFANLVVLHHKKNRGYGGGEKLLRYAVQESAHIVQGSRMLGGGALRGRMPLYKFVANKVLTAIENRAFGLDLAEYHSGYTLYSRKAMQTLPWEKLSTSFDFDLEMIVLALVKGLRIAQVAIPIIYAGENRTSIP